MKSLTVTYQNTIEETIDYFYSKNIFFYLTIQASDPVRYVLFEYGAVVFYGKRPEVEFKV